MSRVTCGAVVLLLSAGVAWADDVDGDGVDDGIDVCNNMPAGSLHGTSGEPSQGRSAREIADVKPPPVAGVTLDRHERPDDPYLPRPPLRLLPKSTPRTVQRGIFTSIQVNTDSEGLNIIGDAANETSMAVDPNDPNRIAIGWREFNTVDSNFREAGWAYSLDGGASWTFPGVIEPGVFRTDPVLDTDLAGNFYYHSLTGQALDECDVFKSVDGGISWGPAVPAFGGDKNWMVVDRSSSIGEGNVYCLWREPFSCCGPNIFTRSTNGGLTFMSPIPVPDSPALGTMAVGPDGELYIAGVLEADGSAFRVVKSTNAQDPGVVPSFASPVSVDMGGALRFWSGGPNPDGLLGQVWVVTDHTAGATRGNVYLLCSVGPPGDDPLDLMITRSTNGGMTWNTPVRVNDDSLDNGAWQWFGTLSIAPNGRLDAFWNDTRRDPGGYDSELFHSYSEDAGQSWSVNRPLTPTFDPHIGWPRQNKLGDYYQSVSDNAGVNIAYAATFNGEQDIYFLRVGDCNENGVHDGIDIAGGASSDCNSTGIPDECETITTGDVDVDGDTDLDDYTVFVDCLAGPEQAPMPASPACAVACLAAFDFGPEDGDVDLADFALFQQGSMGPLAIPGMVIDTVAVGNADNAGELSGEGAGGYGPDRICGAVDYVFNIGKFEVTAGQYTEFLNAVADDDTYGLYNTEMWASSWGCQIRRTGSSGSYEYLVDADGDDVEDADWLDRPVNYVSWGDAARFANWVHNGQPTGAQELSTTEDGSYYLSGAMSDAELLAVVREPNATWVIPSEDEWYKAAYHYNDGVTGNYFDFPTSSDSVPSNDLVEPIDPGNNATFYISGGDSTIGSPYWRTEVGAHEHSDSPYGIFDQGGNVWEWNESILYGSGRGLRGGSYNGTVMLLHAATRPRHLYPADEGGLVGFRVAEVP